jgi:MFS family permease
MRDGTQKLWTFAFVSITLAAFFTSVGCYGLINGLPLYIDSVGGTAALSGVMITAFGIASALGRVVSGNLSDRIGRRKIMLFGAALFILSAFFPIVIPGLKALVFFRILHGVSFAFVTTAANAAAADVLPDARMGEGIGYFGLAQSLAIAVGPTVAITLLQFGGKAYFGGETVLVLFGFVFAWLCRYEARVPLVQKEKKPAQADSGQQTGFIWKVIEKTSLWPSVVFFVFSFACAVVISFAALYARDQDYRYPSLFYTIQAASMILARLTSGRLIDRYSPRRVLTATLLCGVVTFLALTLVRSETVFYAMAVLYGYCVGMMFPLLISFAVRRAPSGRVGAASATLYLFSDSGFAIGSCVWGFVIDSAGGYTARFLGGAACMALAGVIGLLVLRENQATDEESRPASKQGAAAQEQKGTA